MTTCSNTPYTRKKFSRQSWFNLAVSRKFTWYLSLTYSNNCGIAYPAIINAFWQGSRRLTWRNLHKGKTWVRNVRAAFCASGFSPKPHLSSFMSFNWREFKTSKALSTFRINEDWEEYSGKYLFSALPQCSLNSCAANLTFCRSWPSTCNITYCERMAIKHLGNRT